MTRLLIVATVPVTFEAFLMPFARHFRAEGWRVDGMAAGLSGSAAAGGLDRAWDVRWSRDPLDPANLAAAGTIRDVVKAERYDLVHVHTPVAGFVTRWALRRRPDALRVIYTAHGFHFAPGLHPVRNALFLGLEKLAARWTDALVVINEDDAEAAERRRIVAPDRIRKVHGIGIDVDRFDKASVSAREIAEVRAELRMSPDEPLVTMVAEFTANKQHALVFRALAGTRAPVHLALAGDGPLTERARLLARDLGIADRVHFLGWRDDVPAVVAASCATVLFSAREGLPRSSMESLALEVPVIGADIRGLRELLRDGCGLLVPPGDVGALASAIDALVSDPRAAEEMGRKGREKMTGAYSLRSVIAEHEELYRDVLSGFQEAGRRAS